jgi:hypothetical protein
MSFSKKGNNLPKEGNVFPNNSYAVAISVALRQNLGSTHRAIKTIVGWTGASERTAKNWMSGSSGPSGEHLMALAHHSDEVFVTILRLSGNERVLVALNVIEARDKLFAAVDCLR